MNQPGETTAALTGVSVSDYCLSITMLVVAQFYYLLVNFLYYLIFLTCNIFLRTNNILEIIRKAHSDSKCKDDSYISFMSIVLCLRINIGSFEKIIL